MTSPTQVFEPIASRPPPVRVQGAVAWLRTNLFDGWRNTLATLLVLALLALCIPKLLSWAVINAIFVPDNAACRAMVEHSGACWGVVAEKYRLILFGRYPFAEQWRPHWLPTRRSRSASCRKRACWRRSAIRTSCRCTTSA